MKMTRHLLLVLAVSLMFAACGSKEGGNTGGGVARPAATPDPTLSDPRGAFAYQLELLKAGDIEKLTECFRPVRRYLVSPTRVDTGKVQFAGKTLEDVWGEARQADWVNGTQIFEVKDKKGRPFLVMYLIDGKWLSDNVWFG